MPRYQPVPGFLYGGGVLLDNVLVWIKLAATLVGGTVTALLGGWDLMLQALVLFIVLDYITGLISAYINKQLNSQVGFIGICKKILLFVPVVMAYTMDNLMGGEILRSLALWFFIANEGLSIAENLGKSGVKLPQALLTALQQMRDKGGVDNAPQK